MGKLSWGMGLLIVLLSVVALFYGPVRLAPVEVWKALTGGGADASSVFIVWQSRFPGMVTALLSGAALAVSGLLLQTVFSNPLADPSILGVNAGSSLAVAVVMLLWGGSFVAGSFSLSGFLLVVMAAFVGASVIVAILLLVSRVVRNSVTLLIVGIMISYVAGSLISLLNYTSTAEGVHSYIIWGMGNYSGVTLQELPPLSLVLLLGLVGSLLLVKPLNALLIGERNARSLGISVRKARTLLLFVAGGLSAVVTAYCGPISFIGLAVPHMARLMLRSADHRHLLPLTLLTGAVLSLLCHILCSMVGDGGVIPLNVVTPLFGVPVILYVLFRKY